MQVKKQQLEPDMEQQTGSRLLSPWLLNLHAENIRWNAWLDEGQTGISITRTNINNLRCTNDTTLMAQSEEKLKNLLMKVKEESKKVGLEINIQKTKSCQSGSISSWQIDGETMEIVTDFILLGSKITSDGVCSHENKRCLLLGSKAMTNLDSLFHFLLQGIFLFFSFFKPKVSCIACRFFTNWAKIKGKIIMS